MAADPIRPRLTHEESTRYNRHKAYQGVTVAPKPRPAGPRGTEMDSVKYENKTRDDLVAEIESLRAELATLRSEKQKGHREAQREAVGADEVLRQSEQRYRSLVEATSDWVWAVDRNGRYTYASPKVKDLLGYEPKEVLGREPFDLMPPEESKRVRQLFEAIASSGQPIKGLENVNVRKDGQEVVLETSGEPIMDAAGNLVGYQGIDRDVTQRKQAQMALQESEQHFRSLVESAPEAILVQSQGRFVYLNPPMLRLLGASSPEDLLGKDSMKCVAPEFHEAVYERMRFQRETGKPAPSMEEEWLRLDGSRVPVEVTAVAVRYQGREAHLVFTRDITERRQAAESLRASEKRFRRLFEKAPVAISISRDGKTILVNQKYLDLYGFQSLDELVGRPILDRWAPESRERVREYSQRRLRGESPPSEYEGMAQRKDGTPFPVHIVVETIDLPDGPAFIAFLTDITKRKRAEQALADEKRFVEALFASLPGTAFVFDSNGRRIRWNDYCIKILGWSEDDMRQLGVCDIIASRDHQRCSQAFQEAFLNGHAELDLTGLAKDGWEVPYFFNIIRTEFSGEPYIVAVGIDISERKRMEQQLKELNATLEHRVAERTADLRRREEEYRSLYEGIPVGVYRTTFDGRILQANPAAVEMFGYASLDALPRNAAEMYVNPDDRRRLMQRLEAQPTVGDYEAQMRRADGSVIWVHTTASVVRDDAGGILYIEGSVRDITERKRAEAEVLKEKALSEAVINGLPGVFYMFDRQGEMVRWNDEYLRAAEATIQDVANSRILGRIADDDKERVAEAVEAVFAKGQVSIEAEAVTMSGRHIPFHLAARRLQIGDQTYLVGVGYDISERKRAEQALRESEAKYRTLTENVNDIVYSLDTEGRLTYVSPQAAQYGFVPEELVGRSFLAFVASEDRQRVGTEFAKAMRTGTAWPSEFRIQGKAGQAYWFEDHAKVLCDEKGRIVGMSGVLRDITERKRAQTAAELHAQRVRQLAVKLSLAEEQERRRLAALLHDDLVQVLVAIQMRFAVLRRANDELARLREMSQIEPLVARSTQVARSLMSQLSHRALYDTGFVPAVHWLAEDIRRLYGLKVTMQDDGQPKPLAEPVRVLLYQCLREALVNAAKHAKVEEAHVRVHRDGSVVRVVVEDEGVGFNPSAISPKPDGGGFGLFSIEERLEPLGGKVTIRSAPGQGTTVLLEVPVESDGP